MILNLNRCGCCGDDDDVIIVDPPDDWEDWGKGRPGYRTYVAIFKANGGGKFPEILANVGFGINSAVYPYILSANLAFLNGKVTVEIRAGPITGGINACAGFGSVERFGTVNDNTTTADYAYHSGETVIFPVGVGRTQSVGDFALIFLADLAKTGIFGIRMQFRTLEP